MVVRKLVKFVSWLLLLALIGFKESILLSLICFKESDLNSPAGICQNLTTAIVNCGSSAVCLLIGSNWLKQIVYKIYRLECVCSDN